MLIFNCILKITFYFIFFWPSISTASVEKIVSDLKGELIAVQFTKNIKKFKPTLLTYISGTKDSSSPLGMITFKKNRDSVLILKLQLQRVFKGNGKYSYPYSDFDYKILQTTVDLKQFETLNEKLTKIHNMITFKSYDVSYEKPIDFNGGYSKRGRGHGNTNGRAGRYVQIVNLYESKSKGFLYSFSGQPSSENIYQNIKLNAMSKVISNFLNRVTFDKYNEINSDHHTIFNHQYEISRRFYSQELWWWVKGGTLQLARFLGGKKHIPELLKCLDERPKNLKSKHHVRLKYIAVNALSQITGKDFRFNKSGEPLSIEVTAKQYIKHFRH